MRRSGLFSTLAAVTALMTAASLGPLLAQGPAKHPQQAPAKSSKAPLRPYARVPIRLSELQLGPSFDAFRKRLEEIAQKKDRAGLARLVAPNFFWFREAAEATDKQKRAFDNLVDAIDLDGAESSSWDAIFRGWELLEIYTNLGTVMAHKDRAAVFCTPDWPTFDESAVEALLAATKTDDADWTYPVRNGIEVRSAAAPDAPVIETLGLHLVRSLDTKDGPDKVLTPSGKVGYVPDDLRLMPFVHMDPLCYLRDASGWKIAGFHRLPLGPSRQRPTK
jgi:hypothetical protein